MLKVIQLKIDSFNHYPSDFKACYGFKHISNSWASLVAQTVKDLPVMQETWIQPLGWEDPLEGRARQPTPVFLSRAPP